MIVHREYSQGSVEWIEAHLGILSAGLFDQIVDTKWELRTGEMPKTVIARKLAEAWTGRATEDTAGTFFMEQGLFLEQEAIPWFALEYGIEVERVGFVTTDDGKIGCSPDGMIGGNAGIEMKCPAAATHVKYLLAGGLPKDYAPQVYGSMLVTGAPYWYFVSYRRHFPALVLKVNRDEAVMAKLQAAIDEWLAGFGLAMQKLVALNGGPPPPRKRFVPSSPDDPRKELFVSNENDYPH